MKPLGVITFSFFLNSLKFGSLLQQNSSVRPKKPENNLLQTILQDYDKRSRPVENFHLPLEVDFSISLRQIIQVDEKNQLITTNLWRTLFWTDEFLQWDPNDHGNITQVARRMIF